MRTCLSGWIEVTIFCEEIQNGFFNPFSPKIANSPLQLLYIS